MITTKAMRSLAEEWREEGYFVERDVIDRNRADRLKAICEVVFKKWQVRDPLTGQPGGGADATSMRGPHHAEYFRGNDNALGHEDLLELLEAAADPKLLALWREIFGEETHFRGMNFFINPQTGGKDGHWHRDSQFRWKGEEEEKARLREMPVEGTSVQMQLALVPSADLEVVPASHSRWDTEEENAIRRQDERANWRSNAMPGAERVDLQVGDVVAFNPVILHRGRYHSDRPRRTLLFGYTPVSRPSVDKFSHHPWFLEPGYLEGLSTAARDFYNRFVEQYRDSWI